MIKGKTKLDSRCTKGVFVGCDRNSPAYLVHFPGKQNIRKVRCVKFFNQYEHEAVNCNDDEYLSRKIECSLRDENDRHVLDDAPVKLSDVHDNKCDNSDLNQDENTRSGVNVRPQRERKPPKYLDDYVLLQTIMILMWIIVVKC